MSTPASRSSRLDCFAAHSNSDAEYAACVDFAMDALEDGRLKLQAVARLRSFSARGLPWQREHIERLIARLAP